MIRQDLRKEYKGKYANKIYLRISNKNNSRKDKPKPEKYKILCNL
jgi:hypothetical protein